MGTIKGIFEPFQGFVQDQLRIRKKILVGRQNSSKPELFYTYTNVKQGGIRMISGVDLRGTTDHPNPILDPSDPIESKLMGSGLARHWVLEGGLGDEEIQGWENTSTSNESEPVDQTGGWTMVIAENDEGKNALVVLTDPGEIALQEELFPTPPINGYGHRYKWQQQEGGHKLSEVVISEKAIEQRGNRSGIGEIHSAYGDPSIRSGMMDGFGMVPMPGITDATIRTKSDDGSLREAQVNYVCHNRKQLEILEMLYMRPGYPIMLEWGWNPYISNNASIENAKPMLDEFFNSNSDMNLINFEISKRRKQSSGNYDGFVGFVKNFKFEATEAGGYECTTEIMAHGEINIRIMLLGSTHKSKKKR